MTVYISAILLLCMLILTHKVRGSRWCLACDDSITEMNLVNKTTVKLILNSDCLVLNITLCTL